MCYSGSAAAPGRGSRSGEYQSSGGEVVNGDVALNFTTATHPLWLVPIGLGYAVVYHVLCRWAIRRFNLTTPGGTSPSPRAKVGGRARKAPL